MPKIKKMPNTKQQRRYLGPYTVTRVTDSHAVIPDPKAGAGLKKEKKIPIDLIRLYHERDLEIGGNSRKRKSGNSALDSPSKKLRQVNISEM